MISKVKKMIDFILRKIESVVSKISTWIWRLRVKRSHYKRDK
jgi:hypothetical protein